MAFPARLSSSTPVLLSALLAACGGDGSTGTGTDTSTSDTTVGPSTSDTTGTNPTTLASTTDAAELTTSTGPAELTTSDVSTGDTSTGDTSTGDVSTGDTSTGDTTMGVDATTTEGTTTVSTTGDGTTTEGTTTEGTSTTGDTDDSTTGEPSPWDGEPLPEADDGVWTWVPFPESRCRDGSTTGVAVRYGSGPGLVVYFQSGGACFNAQTCGNNIKSFGETSFNNFFANNGQKGIFDPDEQDNPVADWSFVFVPYCTGDVHAGARPDGVLPDLAAPQQFVGYLNVGHYLERVVPTFVDSVDHVLVTGESAGGFGSTYNYDRLAQAFPDRPVTLVNDSGPTMAPPFLTACLQQKWRDVWNLDATLPQDCDACFQPDGSGLTSVAPFLAAKYSDQRLGMISSLGDATIRSFFGFGMNECQGGSMSADLFAAGLADLRDNYLSEPAGVWGTYYLPGQQHTFLLPSYTTAQVGQVRMVDWISDLLAGTATHVAP